MFIFRQGCSAFSNQRSSAPTMPLPQFLYLFYGQECVLCGHLLTRIQTSHNGDILPIHPRLGQNSLFLLRMIRRFVIRLTLKIIVRAVAQRHHAMGEGTVGSKCQTRKEALVGLLVVVSEEMSQTEIKICSWIGRIIIVGRERYIGNPLATVVAEVHF